jgi:phosphate ABC transporter phosphate-binding protein
VKGVATPTNGYRTEETIMLTGRPHSRQTALALVCSVGVSLTLLVGCSKKKEEVSLSPKLSPEVLADIFLGKITNWNDEAIKKDNPDLDLPDQDITVVHRDDGSGTTYVFTSYLSAVSTAWKDGPGTGKSVKWPAKGSLGGKGNPGVASTVKSTKGAIGYVDYADALGNDMVTVQLKNKDGKWVEPGIGAFSAAAANADWEKARNFNVSMINQPGEKSWPITTATYVLLYKEPKDVAKAQKVLQFFSWAYDKGGEAAEKRHYVPLPKDVVKRVEKSWEEIKADGQPIWPVKGEVKADSINGTGATFPAPIYKDWAETYHKNTGVKVDYQGIGSSGGLKAIKDRTADFGASDEPQSPEALEKLGAVQFPGVIGGAVVVVNVKGVK